MKNPLRTSQLDGVLAKHTLQGKRRELNVNPDGVLFDARNLAKAIGRAASGDIILLPPGEYPAFELKKSMEIRSLQLGPVVIRGTIKVQAEFCLLSGLEVRAESDLPALVVEKGTLVVDDCVLRGGINAGAAGANVHLFLRNCLAGHALEGVSLTHLASAEISTSRITNCRIGLALRGGATGAVYNSRLETCVNADESNPGVGLFADHSSVYCEGVTLSANDVGLYLDSCEDVRIFGSLFHASKTSALIALDGATASPLLLRSCVVDRQDSARCAQLTFTGGTVQIVHSVIKQALSPAVTAEQTRLEILDTHLAALGQPAIEAGSCHLSGANITCVSEGSTSLAAAGCQGAVRNSRFVGQPPTTLRDSPQLLFDSCQFNETPDEPSPQEPKETSTIDAMILQLRKFVGQESVRDDLERILRLAHAGQQRKVQGLPVPEQSFHSIFMGPTGTGKFEAAHILAEGLFAFGVVDSPKVTEISLEAETDSPTNGRHPGDNEKGLVFLRARGATSSAAGLAVATQLLVRLVGDSRNVVILEGERDELRRLLRSSQVLSRAFRKTLYFTNYGPAELATHFARLCEFDQIPVSDDALRTILLSVHLFCEKKDKRYANTKGMEMLYEASRRRFLERCSLANRMDLDLAASDLDIPQDKALLTAIERCPAFVTFCPACLKENPWLAGLEEKCICLHCDAAYTANWGIWKDSGTYRRLRASLARPVETGALAPRPQLPLR